MKQSTRRLLAHGTNATFVSLLVLASLVLVYALADQYRARWDMSVDAQNSLLPETLSKLELLDREGIPVEITAFTSQTGKPEASYKNRTVKDLLEELDRRSNVLTWRVVDFDKERLTAERMGVTMYGQMVITRGEDRVDIKDRDLFKRKGKVVDNQWTFLGEGAVNRGLSQLLSPRRRVVYVLSGHGELDPEEKGPDGLSTLVEALDSERYDVETLDLLRSGQEGEAPDVPEDAALVFLARPLAALSAAEEDILLGWVGRGKPLLFAVDVGTAVPALLSRMGVRIGEGTVLDRQLLFPYRDRPLPRYKNHPIVDDLRENNLTTVMAGAAPVVVQEPSPEGIRATPVLVTSREGWVERGGALKDGLSQYEPEIDTAGPANFAVALDLAQASGLVRQGKPAARVLVVGDADAFTNALLDEGPGNGTFAVNAVTWLAGDDARLGVDIQRRTETRRLALSEEDAVRLRWISLGLMPGLVALLGLGTWWSRRGR